MHDRALKTVEAGYVNHSGRAEESNSAEQELGFMDKTAASSIVSDRHLPPLPFLGPLTLLHGGIERDLVREVVLRCDAPQVSLDIGARGQDGTPRRVGLERVAVKDARYVTRTSW